ncbi:MULTISPECIES: diacylglycerol kinase [unclassified Streptomyces]|uniref:Diacylglycerol kinase n=1 Tax=Streptomyces sp. R33 TaxID=3238629 RepID=A0AB39YA89_9ACTN|nr:MULTISPECIES: diacylglycerol kinase [unclassified Streptomyces]KJY46417.1 sphingosine kinase [Streptomyces sp. NRRL S-444]KOY58264.1 sphingosine kinase [Streptomyces sp. XY332]TDU79112.1 diacylglycerol kinase [Streptomyces sp. KS 21]THA39365.1 diacylglycerol kinase [Streptomyces sp. A1547]
MSAEITLLVNPTAGRGRGAHAAQPAASALRAAGFSVRTVLGADAADALSRLRTAVREGTGAVIAVGGDGVVSLALQALAGTLVPLGVVAVGTGNDFARAMGLPVGEPAQAGRLAAEALKEGRIREIDLGRVSRAGAGADGGTWYGTVLCSGFDSRVNDRGNRMRLPAGRFKYDLAILAELAAFRPFPYRITLDDGPVIETEATLVAVGNGTSYGGGMRICADAVPDDGLFDVVVVGDCSRATLLKVFPQVYKGTHLGHPKVTVHRAAKITLEAAGITAYADGEPLGPLPVSADCVPGALRLLA